MNIQEVRGKDSLPPCQPQSVLSFKEVRGEDGLYRCPVCGTVTRRTLDFFGVKREFRIRCQCQKAEDAKEAELARREAEEKATRELRKLSMMDEKLKDASFSTFMESDENREAYRTAVRYVETFDEMLKSGQGLMFYGPVGTGKSYAAAAVANELISRRRSVVMTSFVKLLDGMSRFNTADEDYIAALNRAELLFIDELGAQKGTDTAMEKVYNVIDSRYRSCKPLILTTNLELSEIKGEKDIRYVRIYDRIAEMCYPVRMGGLSWRKREASRRFRVMKALLEG